MTVMKACLALISGYVQNLLQRTCCKELAKETSCQEFIENENQQYEKSLRNSNRYCNAVCCEIPFNVIEIEIIDSIPEKEKCK